MNLANNYNNYKRLHILPTKLDAEALAVFLVSALLVSHGVRRDTLVAANLGNIWLWIPGDKIRYLGPDIDTATGWIRAVLRGKKGLGAQFKGVGPLCEGARKIYFIRNYLKIIINESVARSDRYCIYYYNEVDGVNLGKEGVDAIVGLMGAPMSLAPAIANIILDRSEAGLPLLPRFGYEFLGSRS